MKEQKDALDEIAGNIVEKMIRPIIIERNAYKAAAETMAAKLGLSKKDLDASIKAIKDEIGEKK
jgi:hypothetical protein